MQRDWSNNEQAPSITKVPLKTTAPPYSSTVDNEPTTEKFDASSLLSMSNTVVGKSSSQTNGARSYSLKNPIDKFTYSQENIFLEFTIDPKRLYLSVGYIN